VDPNLKFVLLTKLLVFSETLFGFVAGNVV
jgi:hypothetical protein